MAKTAAPIENFQSKMMPSSGSWGWKEDSNELEFLSNNPNADRQDKRRRAKEGNKRNDRITSSVAKSKGKRGNPPRSPQHPSLKQKSTHTTVTVDYVKTVALQMLSVAEHDGMSETFEGILHTEEFDFFLMHLLNYFHCFFDKLVQEHKINTTTYIEPSLSEKKQYEDSLVKLATAEKLLGQAYCVLELGLGLDTHHHMACGNSRVSSTLKDRSMFETLYSFCAFVVHITFRRKDFNIIKKEIGRILRSDTFNPANQVKKLPDGKQPVSYYKIAAAIRDSKNQKFKKFRKQFINRKERLEAPEGSKDTPTEAKKDPQPIDKMSPAEYRRLQPRRPAIKSIIHQRSPAIVAILPSPKEEAHWLFRRKDALSPESLARMGGNQDDDDAEEFFQDAEGFFLDKKTFKIGIIGEPLSMFNEATLTPLGADNEDEENEGEDSNKQTNSEETTTEKSPPPEARISRQQTAISSGTTDAAFVDDDEEE